MAAGGTVQNLTGLCLGVGGTVQSLFHEPVGIIIQALRKDGAVFFTGGPEIQGGFGEIFAAGLNAAGNVDQQLLVAVGTDFGFFYIARQIGEGCLIGR